MLQHMTELAKSHAALKKEHEKLKKEKESHTIKLNAIVPILKEGLLQDFVMSQIYTILTECSKMRIDIGLLKLALSESNIKSGHHYIILAEPGHPEYKFKLVWVLLDVGYEPGHPEYKFKLEWVAPGTVAVYRFMLYSVVNDIYPAITGMSFGVRIGSYDCGFNDSDRIADVCCGMPFGKVPVSVDNDLKLLGKLDTNSITSKFCVQFIHHKEYRCSCTKPLCACQKLRSRFRFNPPP